MTDAATDTPLVTRTDHDGVVTLTMSNPKRRNALSSAMMTALQDAFDRIANESNVRCVILAAEGPVFCAGHDLKEMSGITECDQHASLFNQCSDLMMTIVSLPQPVIARVRGMATAAGCQLVASCDLAVAADTAKFATPGVNIGLFCSTPMVALSRNIARKHAMRMLLTGDPISADNAFAMGLVSDVVTDDDLVDHTNALAAGIAARSGMTVRLGKQAFYKQVEMPLSQAYSYASDVMTANMQKHDAREGIGAFVEKRHPSWRHE
ncbi:enoyl-CoA hydratase [Thalassospira sp.]|uniref:enoyl-CoA hydratase n=1 Tax=Thalassospira sp. TaxID=1912094 RepID=UPI000C62CC42|nr:enoyl-CoA hydratase [Thalassospira sp.]MBC08106.1 enoyl-CoA hydratase [Thalassospira sp.]|tara:strand:+ start:5273 stop:6067 length:795 start_codon:yes stop_codon:yes gene_type:complete